MQANRARLEAMHIVQHQGIRATLEIVAVNNHMKKLRNNKGMTLVELILYIAILSVFIGGAINFSWDVIYGRIKSNTQRTLSQNLRIVSKRMAYEIRNATAISIPNSSTISLVMADSERNPTVFDLSGGRVRIGYGSSGPCPTTSPCFLSSNELTISNLTFTNLSTGTSTNVQVSITGSTTGSSDEYQGTETYRTSVELRN